MTKKVLITGANRGIGLELCKQHLDAGFEVIAVCRNSSDGLVKLASNGVLSIHEGVDVTDAERLGDLARQIGDTTIDRLVLNAGLLVRDHFQDATLQSLTDQFRVNAAGPLLTIQALRPLLTRGSQVAIITSRMGSIADNTSGGYYGYRASKAAVNIIGASLAVDLADDGISVAMLHPGMVSTRMTGFSGISVEESARNLMQRFEDINQDTSGSFWHAAGQTLPW